MSERWMFKNVIGLNDQEILQVRRERLDDARAKGALEAAGALAGDAGGGDAGADNMEAPDAGGEDAAGGPELETASDDNRGQGDVISGLKETDGPVKIAPALKNSLYNRRRGQRRKTRFPKINDRAVSGATAVPSVPEGKQYLREAFEDLYEDTVESMIEGDTSDKNETTQTQITVKPTFGLSELGMLHGLAEKKKLTVPAAEQWKTESVAKVLVEHYSRPSRVDEQENPQDFELYVVEDGDEKATT